MKIAWDEFRVEDLSKYVKVWRNVINPYFNPAQDYMMLQAIVVAAVGGAWVDEVQDRG
jgi:hypothetical protein